MIYRKENLINFLISKSNNPTYCCANKFKIKTKYREKKEEEDICIDGCILITKIMILYNYLSEFERI
jgi:hypothetical protein